MRAGCLPEPELEESDPLDDDEEEEPLDESWRLRFSSASSSRPPRAGGDALRARGGGGNSRLRLRGGGRRSGLRRRRGDFLARRRESLSDESELLESELLDESESELLESELSDEEELLLEELDGLRRRRSLGALGASRAALRTAASAPGSGGRSAASAKRGRSCGLANCCVREGRAT